MTTDTGQPQPQPEQDAAAEAAARSAAAAALGSAKSPAGEGGVGDEVELFPVDPDLPGSAGLGRCISLLLHHADLEGELRRLTLPRGVPHEVDARGVEPVRGSGAVKLAARGRADEHRRVRAGRGDVEVGARAASLRPTLTTKPCETCTRKVRVLTGKDLR